MVQGLHETRVARQLRDWSLPARFAVYGLSAGLITGVPLGVWLSSPQWMPASWELPGGARRDGPAPRGRDPLRDFNLDGLLVPAEEILAGGPPKDGIPALSDPLTVTVGAVKFLEHDDRVVGVTVGGESRAYPIRLLNYHEVANDEIGGVPIAVVYCPLCDSVSVLDRRIDGQTLSFGVSGLLLHSNVLLYDRSDHALWTQLGDRALSGPYAGRSLTHVNSWELASFGAWAAQHPLGRVASFETGYGLEYRRSPYAAYFETDDLYFHVPRDDRLPRQKTPVVGVRLGGLACAVPVDAVADAPGGRLQVPIAGQRVVLASDPGASEITVVESPMGAQVAHTFWFAWAAFHPGTTLFGSEPSATGTTNSFIEEVGCRP